MSFVDTKITTQAYTALSMLWNTNAERSTTQPSTASISLPIERWRSRWFSSRAIISVPPVVAPRMKTSESPTPSQTPPISVMISGSPW